MRKADMLTAEARADQAALNFGYTRIYSPADGVIGDKSVQVGMQVQPGQELFALTESNDVWVTANFKETQIRRMRPGQPVTIHVDALSQNFDGYIEALPGASGAVYSLLPPENATGNYVKVVQRLPVRIRFRAGERGAERLAPGMSVEPKVWIN
jgi:membrane fusion protein (multidrug efflux system)